MEVNTKEIKSTAFLYLYHQWFKQILEDRADPWPPWPPFRRKVPELEIKMTQNYFYLVKKLRQSQKNPPLVVNTVIVTGPVLLDDKLDS